MATKKITLNEFNYLVKQIIKEEFDNVQLEPHKEEFGNIRFGGHYDRYLKWPNFVSKEIEPRKSEYVKSYLIKNSSNHAVYKGVLNILKNGSAFINVNYVSYSGVKNKYTNYFDKQGREIIDKDDSTRKEQRYFNNIQ